MAEMTNSQMKTKLADFQKKVQEEGYQDIYFERYTMYDGSWGIRCMHKDYPGNACYNTGVAGDMDSKLNRTVEMFDYYVRGNPKYM